MKVFITGVSGFVGTGLVEYLAAKEGFKLYGQSRDVSATATKFKGFNIELFEKYSGALFDSLGIDCVIHLAGIAHDLDGKFRREDYDRVNFENTRSLFTEFSNSNAGKFIFLSSIKACLDSSPSPAKEDAPATPTSDYGISKRKAEEFITNSLRASKHAYILRPCMIHGPGNKGNLNSLYRYLKSGMPYIFGSYSNGRSFLSATNLNFVIEEFMVNTFPSGIYHLADDEPLSTNELVKIVAESLGKPPKIWRIPVGLVDVLTGLGGAFGLPTKRIKGKLTEDLVVSTVKLKATIQKPLPVKTEEGLRATLRSFEK
jgi:nucleoside-diphosphate-sugar epimerase